MPGRETAHAPWWLMIDCAKSAREQNRYKNSAHDPSPGLPRLARVCRYLAVSRKPVSCYAFRVELGLKRLASAVQLRPWPPYFSIMSPFLVPISPRTYCTLLLRLLNRSTTLFVDSGTNCM